jgi:serine/threonine protein kinase
VDPYDAVRQQARQARSDYRLDRAPLDEGGQAQVFGATHKETSVRVAVKRLQSRNPDAVARMKREVECGRTLDGKPHVMPVLDFGAAYEWFVMPMAAGSAEAFAQDLKRAGDLASMVAAVCSALEPAHALGWVHRDIKPANILKLDGQWTLADWGLGRRPRGETTNPGRTRIGVMHGTAGFAAPELSTDAHSATFSADIYSLGQLIGWSITEKWPSRDTPLLPGEGPWRSVVEQSTILDPSRRPQNIQEFRELVAREVGQ